MTRVCATLLFTSVASMNIWGQAGFGGMTGTVRDASQSLVPGAKVVIKNDQKGVRRKGMLMFEGFNVFNTQYNTGIATTDFTASGGVIKPQVGFGLGNASQAFPDGTNARRLQAAFRLIF